MFRIPNKDKKTARARKKNRNPFGRYHEPTRAGHLLVTQDARGISFSEFLIDSPVIRPIVLSPKESSPSLTLQDGSPSQESGDLSSDMEAVSFPDLSDYSTASGDETGSLSDTSGPSSAGESATSLSLPAPSSPLTLNSIRNKFPLQAKTPKGSSLRASRSMDITIADPNGNQQKSLLLFFSPERNEKDTKVHIQSNADKNKASSKKGKAKDDRKRRLTELLQNLSDDEDVVNKDAPASSLIVPPSPASLTKGGNPITLYYCQRKKRNTALKQSDVMGKTAQEELILHIVKNNNSYSAEKVELLKSLAKNFAIEWLHRLAYSLCPKGYEPQDKENLSASPKWINTYMMVLESLAEYFVKKYPNIETIVEPVFKVLPNSDIVEEISYKVELKNSSGMKITMQNTVRALELPSARNWPSYTDSLQACAIAHSLLEKTSPQHKMLLSYR